MSRRLRKNSYFLFFLIFSLFIFKSHAQSNSLSKDEFIRIVKTYHPVVKQVDINMDIARTEIKTANGAFDPVLSSNLRSKELKEKLYYTYFNSEISIPTWYGVDVKAGVDNSSGSYIDPEATPGQLGYIGVKLSANALIFDKRRAALRQAQLLAKMSEYEKILSVNNLIFDALSAYWLWVKEYQQSQLIIAQLLKTEERLRMVRREVEQGSRPAIDTMEAYAQYLTLSQQRTNSELAVNNASLDLSIYLWLENGLSYRLPQTIIPDTSSYNSDANNIPELSQTIAQMASHPKIMMINTKLDMLSIDRKLKMQKLIPNLTVNSALLSDKSFSYINKIDPYNNYKFSADLSIPLFMREARGSLQKSDLKIKELEIEKSYTETQLDIKLKTYYNEYLSLTQQVKDYSNIRYAYNALYNAELQKFNAGESTIFLVNSREIKLLEIAQKLIELKMKQQKAYAGILFSAGLLM